MESKKPSMLRHLRQKMLPHLQRSKMSSSRSPVHFEHTMDHRMSSSVPDMRNVRQMYSHGSSSMQLHHCNSPSFSSPSSSCVELANGPGEGGSGLKTEPVARLAKRTELRLSAPVDSMDCASSPDLLSRVLKNNRSPSDKGGRLVQGIEAEELTPPETRTVYSPELTSVNVSQDGSQVHKIHQSSLIKVST